MQAAFLRFIEFFEVSIDVFSAIFKLLVTSTQPIVSCFMFLKSLIDCIPPVVFPFFLAGIVISIFFLILGRN